MDATRKIAQEITRSVIKRFAESGEPLDLYQTFKSVANGKIIPESRSYFFRQVQARFFRWLSTNESDWRNWPQKARAYLEVPETQAPPTEIESTPTEKPLVPTAMPVKQISLF